VTAKVSDPQALARLAAIIAPALRRLAQPTKKAAPLTRETALRAAGGHGNDQPPA
jgi:hypothetical protein